MQTFDDVTGGATYASGNSTANARNITWSWDDGREDMTLNGKAYCGGKNTSTLSATLPDGVGTIGFQYKYGYDNGTVAVKINGVTVAISPVSTSSAQTFSVTVNLQGSTQVALVTTCRVIIDDITWTDGTPPETDSPTLAITSPAASLTAYNLSTAGTAADNGTDPSGVKEVWVKLDSGSWVKASGTTSWSHDFGSVAEGTYTVSAYAVDNAGNCSATNSITTAVSHPSDTTAPAVTINSAGRTVSGTASDDYGVKEVKVSLDNATWYTATGTTSWSYTFSGLSSGDYTVYVKAVDYADNETSPAVSQAFTVQLPKWTVMVYLASDNDLEQFGMQDFNEMEQGLYDAVQAGNGDITNQLQVIVLMDRASGYDTTDGNWTDTRLFKVLPDNSSSFMNSERLDDGGSAPGHIPNLGEKNMGDPQTLEWFLDYVKVNFPAQNYGLVLWNHGGGARSASSFQPVTRSSGTTRPVFNSAAVKGVKAACWDDSHNDNTGYSDALYLDEIQQAVGTKFSSTEKLGFIGFDACVMATVEVAYEFRNLASYMAASMNFEGGNGWDYQYWFSNIGPADIAADAFAKSIVDQYHAQHGNSNSGETQSAIDLSQLPELKTRVDALAAALQSWVNGNTTTRGTFESIRDTAIHYYGNDDESISYPYYDLWSLADKLAQSGSVPAAVADAAAAVRTQMEAAVIKAYGDSGVTGQSYYFGTDVGNGLTIFVSRGEKQYDSSSHWAYQWWYTSFDEAGDTNGEWLYGNIDFCDYNSNGTVDSWFELFDTWYGNGNKT